MARGGKRDGKTLQLAVLAVGAEHHPDHALSVLHQPKPLGLMAGDHHPAEHISRRARVPNIEQGLDLMPGNLLERENQNRVLAIRYGPPERQTEQWLDGPRSDEDPLDGDHAPASFAIGGGRVDAIGMILTSA